MRIGFLSLMLIATLFGSSFWYGYVDRTCKVPIAYKIGDVDERFGTSKEEIKRIAEKAEVIWEGALGKELFIYDESSSFPINLVFDERQENADKEAELREDLEAKEGMSESVGAQYERLITEFRTLKKKYEGRVVAYEELLQEYNEEVTKWNDNGGAPESVLKDLKESEKSLKGEQGALEGLSEKLNTIVAELNRMGARGNTLIKDYNTIVEEYNEQFSDAHEFTQGDYVQDAINIYQFDSEDELTLVLAHEFGHALSLGHVENEASIMFRTMGTQTLEAGISTEDTIEFTRVCNKGTAVTAFIRVLSGLFQLLPF